MACSARRSLIEKQHTCVGCGCVFRYGMDPTDWRTPMMSQTGKARDAVRCHPCPDCGLYQPEMVMWLQVWHPLVTVVAILPLLSVLCLGMADSSAKAVLAAQVGVGICVTMVLVHFVTAFSNCNSDLKANLALAQEEIANGKLERVSAGTIGSGRGCPRNVGAWHVPGLLMLLAGPVAFVTSIVLLGRQPEPVKNDNLQPAVVTPGKKVSFTFPNVRAEGINNMWRGQPTLRVLNAAELGLPQTLPGQGSDQDWGDKFSVSKGAGNSPIRPTIDFVIPKHSSLSGKSIRISATMQITYPVVSTGYQMMYQKHYFRNATSTVSDIITVKVSDAQVVQATQQAFLIGVGGGAVSYLGSIWLTGVAWALLLRRSKCEVVSEPEPMPPAAPCGSEYGPAAMAGNPAVPDFDRSMWGDRHRRPRQ